LNPHWLCFELEILATTVEGATAVVLVTTTLFALGHYLNLKTTVFAVVDLSFLHIMTM
jgi:hypothetical protein